MFYIVPGILLAIVLLRSIRVIQPQERAVVVRGGRRTNRVVGPGLVIIAPFFDALEKFSMEPFSVSLPPQSAITKDEMPIQLQASIEARVTNPQLIWKCDMDWRTFLMSQLQALMKDRLEELDFDRLDVDFPEWTRSIREQMREKANPIGVEILGLQISNMSPRSRPVA